MQKTSVLDKLSSDERKKLQQLQNMDTAMGERLLKAQRAYYRDKTSAKYNKLIKSETNDFNATQQLINYKIFLTDKYKKGDASKIANKYLQRSSPPYPANEFCDRIKRGNDGKMYVSTPNQNKICTWKLQKCIKINENRIICIA